MTRSSCVPMSVSSGEGSPRASRPFSSAFISDWKAAKAAVPLGPYLQPTTPAADQHTSLNDYECSITSVYLNQAVEDAGQKKTVGWSGGGCGVNWRGTMTSCRLLCCGTAAQGLCYCCCICCCVAWFAPEECREDGAQGVGNAQHDLREAAGQHAQQVVVLRVVLVHAAKVVIEAGLVAA